MPNYYGYQFDKTQTERFELGTVNGNYYNCTVTMQSDRCNPETYTSGLTVTIEIFETTNGNTHAYYNSVMDYAVTVQDKRVTRQTYGKTEIFFTVLHDKLNRSGYIPIEIEIRGIVSKNITVSSFKLNEIPRPADLGIDTLQKFINESFNLELDHKYVGNLSGTGLSLYYDYYISYSINNAQYVDLVHYTPGSQAVTNNTSIIIPESACSFLPNSTSGTITIKCSTYARTDYDSSTEYSSYLGDTFITFPIYIWNLVPTITKLTVEPYCTIPDMLVNEGQYLMNIHKANIKIAVNKPYNASLKSYKVVGILNGVSKTLISGVIENQAQEVDLMNRGVLTPLLTEFGDMTISVTVTDSRGAVSAAKTANILIRASSNAVDGTFNAFRCDSSGALNENGSCIKLECDVAISDDYSISEVDAYFNLYVRDSNGEFTLVESREINITSYVIETSTIFTSIDTSFDYKAELFVDHYWMPVRATKMVPSAGAIIDIAPNGNVAIGKVANTDNLNELKFEVGVMQVNYGNIVPNETGKRDLGDDDHRWRTIYSVNVLDTSDMTYKENISYVAPSNKVRSGEENITQEDLHNFYKSDYLLATYNYIGQEQTEYGFITQDMYDNIVGESLIIRSDSGDMFSINSYISSIAGALQYEINLRDQQIAALLERIEALENGD